MNVCPNPAQAEVPNVGGDELADCLTLSSARRGRRAPKEIHFNEEQLYRLMEDWPDSYPSKHYLGGGLLALMHPEGTLSIKLKYRFQGREQQLHLGEFGWCDPEEILDKYRRAKEALRSGIDPREQNRAEEDSLKQALFGIQQIIQECRSRLRTAEER